MPTRNAKRRQLFGGVFLCLLWLWPTILQAQADWYRTEGLGVQLFQSGDAIAIDEEGVGYVARLAPAPFLLATGLPGENDLFLTISTTPLIYDLHSLGSERLFADAYAYAFDPQAFPTYFLSDPACMGVGDNFGFHIIRPENWRPDGYAIQRVEVDRGHLDCEVPDALARGETLISEGRRLYLIISDGEGAEYLTLLFGEETG